jgi:competence protein ComEC
VVRVSEGVGILVDAGPDPPALSKCLADLHVSRLALVLFSHEHDDHVAGAAGLARHVKIDLVLVRAGLSTSGQASLPAFLGDATVPVAPTWTGQVVTVGQVRWTTIRSGPLMQATTAPAEGEDPAPNNASTIGLLEVGGLRVLFTGDAETEEQSLVDASGAGLTADVLKVPHHGSARQDAGFLAASHAAMAVISVGAQNDYGHPAARTVTTLQADGMRVYRTDEMGGVALVRSAQGITVRTQHRGP